MKGEKKEWKKKREGGGSKVRKKGIEEWQEGGEE